MRRWSVDDTLRAPALPAGDALLHACRVRLLASDVRPRAFAGLRHLLMHFPNLLLRRAMADARQIGKYVEEIVA